MTGAHEIQVLDGDGKRRRRWGGPGSAPGQLLAPRGIAVAPDGRVVVSDSGNHRMQIFAADGSSALVFGRRGKGPGELLAPHGVCVTEQHIVVADRGNHRIQVFSRDGKPLAQLGGFGTGKGRFRDPVHVAVDEAGNLYVADAGNARIQKLDPEGGYLTSWGGRGPFPGLLAEPSALVWHQGRLFVADSTNHRIQAFSGDGDVLFQWGRHAGLPHEGQGALHYPSGIAVSADGTLAVVAEGFEDRCQIFDALGEGVEGEQAVPLGSRTTDLHYGARCSLAGDLMAIADPDAHRLMLYNTTHPTPINVSRLGGYGTSFGRFIAPAGLALDDSRSFVYVSDPGNRRLQVFHIRKDPVVRFNPRMCRFVRSLQLDRAPGIPADAWIVAPTAIRVDGAGNPHLLDSRQARVFRLDPDLEIQGNWGRYGSGPGEFLHPVDLAFHGDGNRIYVADSLRCDVQVFDASGRFLAAWGKRGSVPGEFLQPAGIAVARDGSVYVTDATLHRVSRFDEDGKHLRSWGSRGLAAGQLFKPAGIGQDRDGRIIVVDWGNHRGMIFTPEGEFVRAFGARIFVRPSRRKAL